MPPAAAPEVYIVVNGQRAEREALRLAEQLRDALPGRGVLLNLGGGNFKTQFRRADRSGARLALILGDEELDRGRGRGETFAPRGRSDRLSVERNCPRASRRCCRVAVGES